MDSFPARLQANVSRVLIGKDQAVEQAIVALLAGGHLLIEDRPGVGKTLLARALARSLDLPFQRIQATADLLPADILGGQVYDQRTGDITFKEGPVFTSVLVADELNRTPPRTQSALLECMQERRVTVDRRSYELPDPFFVVATQNPLNFAGTYPLPESQLDRFLMRIHLGYPEPDDEIEIVAREDGHSALATIQPIADRDDLLGNRAAVEGVRVERELIAYMVELARRTRTNGEVSLGISSRGTQALHRACRARAVVHGRDYVVPEDIRMLVRPVFGHRLKIRGGDGAAEALVSEIMETTAAPV